MGQFENCTDVSVLCPVEASTYGYAPSLGANATLLALFAIVLIVQVGQGILYKTWGFMAAFAIGSFGEVVGKLDLSRRYKPELHAN
jgi:hypothetical protein